MSGTKGSGGSSAVAAFRGCWAYKVADLTAQNVTGGAVVTWDAELYDTDAWHSTSSNTSRMTVPAGVNYVRLYGNVTFANHTANKYAIIYMAKNGGAMTGNITAIVQYNATTNAPQYATPPIPVVAGDYFEMFIVVETDTSVDIKGTSANSYFAIEACG